MQLLRNFVCMHRVGAGLISIIFMLRGSVEGPESGIPSGWAGGGGG